VTTTSLIWFVLWSVVLGGSAFAGGWFCKTADCIENGCLDEDEESDCDYPDCNCCVKLNCEPLPQRE
jgi:hypothetical protein